MKKKVTRSKFDPTQAAEQFERYKETGNGKIPVLNQNKLGYSAAYADGWERIFGKDTIVIDDAEVEEKKT